MPRVSKMRVDLTDFNKLSKAALIMLVQANSNLSSGFSKKNPSIRLEIKTKTSLERFQSYKYRSSNDPFTLSRKAIKGKSKFVKLDAHTPKRFIECIDKIRELYPRISQIEPSSRVTSVDTLSVDEESVDWAEQVAKSFNLSVDKDKFVTTTVVTRQQASSFIDIHDARAKEKFLRRVQVSQNRFNGVNVKRKTITVEDTEVKDI